MKFVLLIILALTLFACEKSSKDITSAFALPEGLNDCKIFVLDSEYGGQVTVIRCPSSSTTTQYKVGKRTECLTTTEEEQ